jgi:hypothetical protein
MRRKSVSFYNIEVSNRTRVLVHSEVQRQRNGIYSTEPNSHTTRGLLPSTSQKRFLWLSIHGGAYGHSRRAFLTRKQNTRSHKKCAISYSPRSLCRPSLSIHIDECRVCVPGFNLTPGLQAGQDMTEFVLHLLSETRASLQNGHGVPLSVHYLKVKWHRKKHVNMWHYITSLLSEAIFIYCSVGIHEKCFTSTFHQCPRDF